MRIVALLSLLPFLSGCTGLGLLGAVADTPGGVTRIEGVSYGPLPRQALDLYVPQGEGPFPTLVFVHGGSWASGDKDGYAFVGRQFAGAGYLTAVPNYRLVPAGQWPGFMEDTAAAIVKTLEMAPDRGGSGEEVFLVGHSAGAYNAALVALDPRFLEDAGGSVRTVKAVAALSGPYDVEDAEDATIGAAFGPVAGTPEMRAVTYVTPDAPPMLLVHGTGDETVAIRHAEVLLAALQAAGVEAELLRLEGAGHVAPIIQLARPGRGPTLEAVLGFFAGE